MTKKQGLIGIKKYVRAANYLSAGQLYLWDNFLLERKLSFNDIKPRLLGHWGTVPGINFVYANLNYFIKKHRLSVLFVLGPGHGYPALQANLFLEGTLGKYYPKATHSQEGIGFLMKSFSWPYAFPSHSNPETPGVILEGGELGYSLSTSYGAVLDNPNLIVACLIGDGEAETGALATSWHLNKFLNPQTDGVVLPILHLNGYKISGPTILGRLEDKELKSLFYGYGYKPYIVDERKGDIYQKMIDVLENCYRDIKKIKNSKTRPRYPMIILRTPKGWTGIKKLNNQKIEGNCLAHQVPAPNAKTNEKELQAVEKWLRSYKFNQLFSKSGFDKDILNIIPDDDFKMGNNRNAFGDTVKELVLPPIEKFSEEVPAPGTIGSSSMRRAGLYLNEVFKLNKKNNNFRFFSPDETYSNKLDAIFNETSRVFNLPIKSWDKDLKKYGKVIEMLSEHSLQGLFQGYVLTGRHGIFASYEAFIQIVSSMVDQYSKFLKIARDVSWRKPIPSLNYILTSSGWRQEHNGFSHQNPGFIDDVLRKHGCFINVYFPPDASSTLAVLKKCLSSRNEINVIVAGKTLEPRWLTPSEANEELKTGLMIWDFASDQNPDIVLAAVGDYLSKESLAAITIIKKEAPEIKLRFVNIMELSALGIGGNVCKAPIVFSDYFTSDKPVIFNFHGYPETIKQMLFDVEKNNNRFSVHGYIENGSTTTPYDMQIRNGTSRWHLAIEVFEKMRNIKISSSKADKLIKKYNDKFLWHKNYIIKNGVDPDEIENWQWKRFW